MRLPLVERAERRATAQKRGMVLFDEMQRRLLGEDGDLWEAVMGTAHPAYVDSNVIVRAANDAVCLGRVSLGRYSQADLITALLAAMGCYEISI